jgi:Flp pilus assembly protein TadG
MTGHTKKPQAGASVLEFTLVGIPIIFFLISTFEIARGMWNYHALAYAVREGTRYASVHGVNCATAPNTCTVTIAQITQRILDAGIGLTSSQLQLTFTHTGGATACTANSCLANNTAWPPAPGNAVGNYIQIDATLPFQSAICMFWPGAGPGSTFGTFNFPASSRDTIQF